VEELRDVLFLLRGVPHGDPHGAESIQGGRRYGSERPGECVRPDVGGENFAGGSRVSAQVGTARAAAHAHGKVGAGGAQALWGEEAGASMRVFGSRGDGREGGGGGRGGGGGEFGGGGGGGDGGISSGPSAFEEIQQVCLSHFCRSC
jgi:hypothetical protein